MKRIALIAAGFALLACGQVFAGSITVTKPAANDVWIKGSSHAIEWVKQGGAIASILLIDPADTTTVQVIDNAAPNSGSYQWTPIPANVADGQYKIKVRVSGSTWGNSAQFTIATQGQSGGFKPQPGQVAQLTPTPGFKPVLEKAPPVKILEPMSGETWKVGETFMINWTSDTKPDDGFTVDLLKADGTKVTTMLDGAAQKRPDGSWLIWDGVACSEPAGDYRVRVTSWYAQKGATSGLVHAVIETKKIVENIPVQFQNAILECRDPNNIGSCQANYQLPGGRAETGYEFFQNDAHYRFCIFRTRLTLDLSVFQGKNGDVESATLLPGDAQTYGGPFCAGSLVALSNADVNNWNRYKVPQNAILYPLSGWSAPFQGTGVDITTPVRAWINKTALNLGFVATGADQVGGGGMCDSSFTPIMYVTFIEKTGPCAQQ